MFAYPTFKNGKANRQYEIMAEMIAGNYKTVVANGDSATWVNITGSFDTSYFMPRGEKDIDNMACSQRMRGAFINNYTSSKKEYKNSWNVDMLITNVRSVDADEEKGLAAYVEVKGYWIDDYNERVADLKLQARDEAAMAYISGLEASKDVPYYVNVRGGLRKVERVSIRKNAFGEDEKETYSSTQYVITAMDPDPYDFYDDSIMGEAAYKELVDSLETFKREQFEKQQSADDDGLTF